jgi:hypothetical protein
MNARKRNYFAEGLRAAMEPPRHNNLDCLELLKWAQNSRSKRAALRLHYGDDRPVRWLASDFRVSRSAIHRARRELREMLFTP